MRGTKHTLGAAGKLYGSEGRVEAVFMEIPVSPPTNQKFRLENRNW